MSKIEIFRTRMPVRFRHADPSGILFFGNIFKMAHDVYEDFVAYLGMSYDEWFQNPEWAVPIRHSQSEHFYPLKPAQVYHVEVLVERIGKSSFTLRYVFKEDFEDDSERVVCEVALVHTFFSKKQKSKMSMPPAVRSLLESYQSHTQ